MSRLKHQFKVGQTVKLADRNTHYGDNGIPDGFWGGDALVDEIDGWCSDKEPTYYVLPEGSRCHYHVVEQMLESPGGPW